MPEPIKLEELVSAGVNAAVREIHTSMPGIVRGYDPVSNRASIEVVIATKEISINIDTNKVSTVVTPTLLPNVPVAWPAGGNFALLMPLKPGDTGMITYCERSTAEWLQSGEVSALPADTRRLSMGYPVFTPSLMRGDALKELDSAARQGVVLGYLGEEAQSQIRILPQWIMLGAEATQAVALAPGILITFDAIQNAINALAVFVGALNAGFVAHPAALLGADMTAAVAAATSALTAAIADLTAAVPAAATSVPATVVLGQ